MSKLIGVACGVAAVAGCTGAHHSQTINVVAASAAATTDAQTVEIDTTFTQTGQTATTQRMLYDFQHQIGEVLPDHNLDGTGTGEVIIDGTTIFMELTDLPLMGLNLHGETWLEQQMPPLGGSLKELANLFDPMGPGGDMASVLTKLAPLVTATHKVGAAKVGGVPTIEYEITLSASAMSAVVGASAGTSVGPFDPVMMWVDDQQRVRQLRISLSVPQLGKVTETSDYSHFGLPVHVTIPPASQVLTLQQLQKDMTACVPAGFPSAASARPQISESGSQIQACSKINFSVPTVTAAPNS